MSLCALVEHSSFMGFRISLLKEVFVRFLLCRRKSDSAELTLGTNPQAVGSLKKLFGFQPFAGEAEKKRQNSWTVGSLKKLFGFQPFKEEHMNCVMNDFHSDLLASLQSGESSNQPVNAATLPQESVAADTDPQLSQIPLTVDIQPARLQIPSEMAVNYHLLKMYVDVIPLFDGNTFLLNDFITSCDELVNSFASQTNQNQNLFLLRAVRSKLVGQAQQLISSRLEITQWQQIKELLLQNFGDPRDLPCLQQDMLHLQFDRQKQTLQQFGNQVREFQSLLMAKLQQTDKDLQVKLALSDVYQQLAVDTYVRNLPAQLQQMVRTKEMTTLEDVIAFVTKEEQFAHYKQSISAPSQKPRMNQMNPNTRPDFQRHSFNNRPTTQNLFQRNNPQSQNFSQTQPFQNPQFNRNTQFPSAPINIQPRPVPQRFPTNAQVFGKPQNVWKPKNNSTSNHPQPTPMSGVSALPRRPYQHNQYFSRPTPMSGISNQPRRQPFHSTELFNTELQDNFEYEPTFENFENYQEDSYDFDDHVEAIPEDENIIANPGSINENIDDLLENVPEPDPEAFQDLIDSLELNQDQNPTKNQSMPQLSDNNDNNSTSNDPDNETIHSASENPILQIPITDNPLNFFSHQIVINESSNSICETCSTEKLFSNKIRHSITLRSKLADVDVEDTDETRQIDKPTEDDAESTTAHDIDPADDKPCQTRRYYTRSSAKSNLPPKK
ncbi:hypothetical protein NQ317_002600 [Molorchus minor]|uniref:Uncharacterized protein n=1 Tax=Molorchus minor TaxID=1323400 RepID=A0ABQ9JV40_9CUCU|nr:hypothetical protein NQ317_002600 [Molorchus minor]